MAEKIPLDMAPSDPVLSAVEHMSTNTLEVEIVRKGWRCLRCKHEWVPVLKEKPRRCPNCTDPNWDRPRGYASAKANALRRGSSAVAGKARKPRK